MGFDDAGDLAPGIVFVLPSSAYISSCIPMAMALRMLMPVSVSFSISDPFQTISHCSGNDWYCFQFTPFDQTISRRETTLIIIVGKNYSAFHFSASENFVLG